MAKKQELNRKEYLKLKKMDHADMADYINAVYQRGFDEAQKEFVKTEQSIEDIKAAVEEVLNNIPGIGAKRKELIMQGLEERIG